MMGDKGILWTVDDGDLGFWCPGCEEMHVVSAAGWKFDGNYDAPTFDPSILVRNGHYAHRDTPHLHGDSCWCTYNAEHPDDPSKFTCKQCHSFVRGGQIQFLTDSTHALAGQTIALAPPPSDPEAQRG